jgi:hypothetical protein
VGTDAGEPSSRPGGEQVTSGRNGPTELSPPCLAGQSARFAAEHLLQQWRGVQDGPRSLLIRHPCRSRVNILDSRVDLAANAESLHITMNALAIENEEMDLAHWYRHNIVPAWLRGSDEVDSFGKAIQTKLIKEIRPLVVARTFRREGD